MIAVRVFEALSQRQDPRLGGSRSALCGRDGLGGRRLLLGVGPQGRNEAGQSEGYPEAPLEAWGESHGAKLPHQRRLDAWLSRA